MLDRAILALRSRLITLDMLASPCELDRAQTGYSQLSSGLRSLQVYSLFSCTLNIPLEVTVSTLSILHDQVG
jgi:hypothetical protein